MPRIYGDELNIDEKAMEDFWEMRAEKYSEEHPYVSVKLNDKNPDFSDKIDEYERKNVMPMLNIKDDSYVIDIGCGVGRLAESIVDQCRYYLGTDVSEGLLQIARKRIVSETECDFLPMAFQELDNVSEKVKYSGRYNRVIIVGVLLFMNDAELTKSLENLLTILDEHAVIYISVSVALEERITLTEWESQDFEGEYNAIYRTREEYMKLYKPLLDAGFKVSHQDFLAKEFQRFSETARYYLILER
ncbi:MAG: class I SAM-dependent methyltransferase [Lachnospiraceae bacterium]|nr:class I SAM-dependent methyltransferase [Lachnospiraceae bacterium]